MDDYQCAFDLRQLDIQLAGDFAQIGGDITCFVQLTDQVPGDELLFRGGRDSADLLFKMLPKYEILV